MALKHAEQLFNLFLCEMCKQIETSSCEICLRLANAARGWTRARYGIAPPAVRIGAKSGEKSGKNGRSG